MNSVMLLPITMCTSHNNYIFAMFSSSSVCFHSLDNNVDDLYSSLKTQKPTLKLRGELVKNLQRPYSSLKRVCSGSIRSDEETQTVQPL